MKRGIFSGLAALGVIGVIAGLGAAPASAQSYDYRGWRDVQGIRSDMRDIHGDNRAVAHDRMNLRRDYAHHDYRAVQEDRRNLRQDLRNRAVDRGDLRHDDHHW